MTKKLPWWRIDDYHSESVPLAFEKLAGPKGPALVRAWPDGRTDAGWGGETFMDHYNRGEYNARRILYGYGRGKWAFAFVMRSVNLVCIDIDGKNGGLEHAKRLGALPYTLAETSKSGDGYHLFYSTEGDWDPREGFAEFGDRIGLEQGVDIRATGCVYHHEQQRWNTRAVAPLPEHLAEALKHRAQKVAASNARILSVLGTQDDLEILMMQSDLEEKLAKPITKGKRNQTLFAIGSQMNLAQVPDWEDKVVDRAIAVGLDSAEIDKLIANIQRYAGQHVPGLSTP